MLIVIIRWNGINIKNNNHEPFFLHSKPIKYTTRYIEKYPAVTDRGWRFVGDGIC